MDADKQTVRHCLGYRQPGSQIQRLFPAPIVPRRVIQQLILRACQDGRDACRFQVIPEAEGYRQIDIFLEQTVGALRTAVLRRDLRL